VRGIAGMREGNGRDAGREWQGAGRELQGCVRGMAFNLLKTSHVCIINIKLK